jgi:peptide/nickel transport system permease protein
MRPLLRLVVSRVAQGAALLLLTSFLLFGILSHLPGDPVDLLVASNPALSVDDVARLKRLRGLDQPWPVQWWRWLYGHHAPKVPPPERELPAIVGVLPAPRPFQLTTSIPAPACDGSPATLCARALPPSTLTPSTLTPAASTSATTSTLTALLPEAGATLLFVVVEDGDGQQALWRVPVYVAPPRPAVLERVAGVVDEDGNVVDVDAAAAVADVDDRDGPALRRAASEKRALPPPPRAKDDPTIVGQRVLEEPGGPVVVRGVPVVDDSVFVGGFVFGELGFSHATKRPVRDLLLGEPVVCGDGVVGPGEGCDDGNKVDVDGCSSACVVDGADVVDRVSVAVAGAAAGQGRIGNTLALTVPALAFALVLALGLGSWAGRKTGSVVDVVVRVGAALTSSTPAFFVGLLVIWLFAEQLRLLPSGGLQAPGIARAGGAAAVMSRVEHLLLPWLVLAVFWSGRFVRQVRSAVAAAVAGEHVRSARARGVDGVALFVRHVLPNAAVPLVTLLGLSLPSLFGGALLTETVFAYPGMGRLQYDAIQQNDSYVAIVVFLGNAALVLAGSLLADVVVFALDPRTRAASAGGRS